jgi:amino acid adenylation domain-containing protein
LHIRPDDIAYLIYTSGSTGRPKGVVLEHQNLFNFLVGVSAVPGISQVDRVLAVSSFSFDIAIQELLLPLVHGAQSFILDKYQRKDPKEILQVIESEKITLMFATPAHWKMMLESDWQKPFPDLNIVCGGEHLTNQLAARLFAMGKSLWNIYGPTETTVFSTVKQIKSPDELITIGKPVYNTQIYILNDALDPVETGIEGEIFISGKGVSRGYLNRPELTAEKFLKDPFHPEEDRKMYRTGDLGKFLPNGEIVILGRKDLQVKLRGHRIELGEIEHALIQLKDIKDAVVLLREDFPGNPRLTAYVILSGDDLKTGEMGKIDPGENVSEVVSERPKQWKRELTLSLPSFMVPTDFVVMEKFPINSNGKTDRKAFPQPDFDVIEEQVDKLLPETPEEELVGRIWGDALGIKDINITDNFFEIGGHSLIAVQVMTHLEKESGIKLPLSILFEYPTIKKLAWLIKSKGKNQPWKSLVFIKPSGNKDPLYIVHGGGLNVLPFYAIAKQLDAEQPLYGIQAYGLNGKDEPHSTVEVMAAHYVDEILSQNPKGPYALAGYSFGGIIAYEMAKQLKKQGKQIKSLIMFDTYAIRSDHRDGFLKKMTNRFLTEIGKRFFDLELMITNPAILKRVKKNSLQKKLNKFKKRLPVKQQVRETEIMEIIKNIRKVHKEAGKNYIITPYDGAVHLFRAKTRTGYQKDFKYFGWKPFVNKIHIIEMEGEHTTMFSPPHEKNFVKILQEILNSADKIL